jgi:hypothetical protein
MNNRIKNFNTFNENNVSYSSMGVNRDTNKKMSVLIPGELFKSGDLDRLYEFLYKKGVDIPTEYKGLQLKGKTGGGNEEYTFIVDIADNRLPWKMNFMVPKAYETKMSELSTYVMQQFIEKCDDDTKRKILELNQRFTKFKVSLNKTNSCNKIEGWTITAKGADVTDVYINTLNKEVDIICH